MKYINTFTNGNHIFEARDDDVQLMRKAFEAYYHQTDCSPALPPSDRDAIVADMTNFMKAVLQSQGGNDNG